MGNPNHDPKTGEFSSAGRAHTVASFDALDEAKRSWRGAEWNHAKQQSSTTKARLDKAIAKYAAEKKKAGIV